MKRIKYGVRWLSKRPRAVLNVGFILFIVGLAIWLMVRPLDVLQDWTLSTTSDEQQNGMPVFYPGETMEFTSKSRKVADTTGTTNRVFDCDASGPAQAREIALDKLIANRPAGYNPPKENSITVPDVVQFNGLPRTCRLVITINYEIFPGRNVIESASTNDFIVKERELDSTEIKRQIDQLNQRIDELEKQLAKAEATPPGVTGDTTMITTTNPQHTATVTQASPAQAQTVTPPAPSMTSQTPSQSVPAAAEEQPGLLGRVVGGVGNLLKTVTGALGL